MPLVSTFRACQLSDWARRGVVRAVDSLESDTARKLVDVEVEHGVHSDVVTSTCIQVRHIATTVADYFERVSIMFRQQSLKRMNLVRLHLTEASRCGYRSTTTVHFSAERPSGRFGAKREGHGDGRVGLHDARVISKCSGPP